MQSRNLTHAGHTPLQSGGQNRRWPRSGQIGYITPAALGVPTASERGAVSEVAHKRARGQEGYIMIAA